MRCSRPQAALVAGAVACLLAAPAAAVGGTVAAVPATGMMTATQAEPPITATGVEGEYLRALHIRIHFRWVNKFLDTVARARPPTDPLNRPDLHAEVLFTIRWDGSPAEVTLSQTSGVPAFDAAVITTVRGEMPYPVPPVELYGDDGVAHFRWAFARDHRLCSDGEVRRREDSLGESLPRLLVQGRNKEALLRVARHMRGGDADAMSAFARAWLGRPVADPVADARAAAALARGGDKRQVDRLRRAFGRSDTFPIAAAALVAVKVDLCPLLLPMLAEPDPARVTMATRALREAAAETTIAAACAQRLAAMANDAALPAVVRADALETYAVLDYAGARKQALAAMEAPEAAMRAAGARAFARPGGGRAALYRLQPLLHDPAVEVRAAVAAALVRACGDLARDHVLPLFKEKTTLPLLAMVPELGRQSSPGSAELLGKMLARNDPELRSAVTVALAARRDAPGRALFQPLSDAVRRNQRASADARIMAYSGAEADELLPLARDPVIGILAFKALLKAKRHQDAADWLVESFDRLAPATLADALGAWLANPPARVTATSRRGTDGG